MIFLCTVSLSIVPGEPYQTGRGSATKRALHPMVAFQKHSLLTTYHNWLVYKLLLMHFLVLLHLRLFRVLDKKDPVSDSCVRHKNNRECLMPALQYWCSGIRWFEMSSATRVPHMSGIYRHPMTTVAWAGACISRAQHSTTLYILRIPNFRSGRPIVFCPWHILWNVLLLYICVHVIFPSCRLVTVLPDDAPLI